jgi:ubiquinol-cytochrome c reductase cytochrome b subunit
MATTASNPLPGHTAELDQLPGRPSRTRRFFDALDSRLGLDALRYPVPEHANNLAWSLGGLTACALVVLIITGLILTQYYEPTPEVANQSVRYIVQSVVLGRFMRGVHFWTAQAMYVLAALHLIRIFFHGSYKRPREGNWLIGVSMFGLTLLAIFTGTVLKWDQEGYEALAHNIEVGKLLGGAGLWFSPTFAANTPILVRLYSAHIVLIPGLIVVLFFIHALLIKRHHISSHPSIEDGAADSVAGPVGESGSATADGAQPTASSSVTRTESPEVDEPFTHHLRRVGAFGLVLLAAVTLLAVLFPPPIGPTPVAGIEVTKPMWPFWWMFTLENWIGLPGIIWGAVVFFALLVATPFIDRNPARSWRKRPVAMSLGAVVLLALVVMTILMAITTPAAHLGM